jgi:hypothetical protein
MTNSLLPKNVISLNSIQLLPKNILYYKNNIYKKILGNNNIKITENVNSIAKIDNMNDFYNNIDNEIIDNILNNINSTLVKLYNEKKIYDTVFKFSYFIKSINKINIYNY